MANPPVKPWERCFSSLYWRSWPFTRRKRLDLTAVSRVINFSQFDFFMDLLSFSPEPRLFGEKVPNRLISPRVRRVQRRIVMLHDFFRTKVVPPASNMLSMVSVKMSRSLPVGSCLYWQLQLVCVGDDEEIITKLNNQTRADHWWQFIRRRGDHQRSVVGVRADQWGSRGANLPGINKYPPDERWWSWCLIWTGRLFQLNWMAAETIKK